MKCATIQMSQNLQDRLLGKIKMNIERKPNATEGSLSDSLSIQSPLVQRRSRPGDDLIPPEKEAHPQTGLTLVKIHCGAVKIKYAAF